MLSSLHPASRLVIKCLEDNSGGCKEDAVGGRMALLILNTCSGAFQNRVCVCTYVYNVYIYIYMYIYIHIYIYIHMYVRVWVCGAKSSFHETALKS